MKIFLGILLLGFSLKGISQPANAIYFDENMQPVSKKQALFYGTGVMENGLYKFTCYYIKKKNQIAFVESYKDSTRQVREGEFNAFSENGSPLSIGKYVDGEMEGLWKMYGPSGKIDEEIEYNNGKPEKRTSYFDLTQNRQRLVAVDDSKNNNFHSTLFDQSGNVVSEENFQQEYTDIVIDADTPATFKGGIKEWMRYFTKMISGQFNELTELENGTVLIRFVIDTNGDVSNIRALNMQNTLMAKIAINAIEKSPRWIPASHNGKVIKSFKVQPFTIVNPGF